jgi:pimeloyl-ACP methyl ester carboxylesterase
MKKSILLFILLLSAICFSQEKNEKEVFNKEEITISSLLKGSLYAPLKQNKKTTLVILIAGSGPTDRDGNQKGLTNNSLKYVSEELAKNEIVVFSYDKRIIAQMLSGTANEATLSFDDFINDAKEVVTFFKNKKKYNKIIIAGHSEGSLIGMIAAKDNANAFISLAGAGRTIDSVVEDQIEKQAPTLKEEVQNYFAILKKGETFELKNPMLASIFRESVQPYMISWIKYNPQNEIKKLQIPVLIINGTKDLQVGVAEAELLKQAKPDAKMEIIENMNHLFKEIKGDEKENKAAYTNPDLPVMQELILKINRFIKAL